MNIDYTKDKDVTELAKGILLDRYMVDGETSPQEAFARAAKAYASNDDHAQRLYNYVSDRWFMFSTPVLANGGTKRGLPISCFLPYVEDSIGGLISHHAETVYLSVTGGGVGSYWGHIRSIGQGTSKGNTTPGIMPFIMEQAHDNMVSNYNDPNTPRLSGLLKYTDYQMLGYRQGSTRRGSSAVYLDVTHPEIVEFLEIRKPTGGDPSRKCLNLHHAVCIPDTFMEAVKAGTTYGLIDPHSKEVVGQEDARKMWARILDLRLETGEPYLFFGDTANAGLPKEMKEAGLKIHASNLCNEIYLPTNQDRTAVCCLSSVNLEKFDEWKDHPTFISDLIEMLDNVIEDFLDKAPSEMQKARYSAYMSRDLGLGAMGFHAYLMNNGVPFESAVAEAHNRRMFKHIKEKAVEATKKLAEERGSCPDVPGVRNAHLLAVAPNASSALICGTSPGVEPYNALAYRQDTLSGSHIIEVKALKTALQKYGLDTKATWEQIKKEGTVRNIVGLPDEEKDVFKTAFEIDQSWIVHHASVRQQYICQGQSINLFFPSNVDRKYYGRVHWEAWKKGLKGLYYCRSRAPRSTEAMGSVLGGDCLSCEG